MELKLALRQIDERMEHALRESRFDTFNHLASERFRILQSCLPNSKNGNIAKQARQRTSRWMRIIEKRMQEARIRQQCSEMMGRNYGNVHRPGRVLNRSL